jgi:toxin-antitoxin system PIN domain toxin
MIAVDTNILVYANRRSMPDWHEPAKASLERLANGRAPWGLPWSVVHEFVAVVTRLKQAPATLDEAFAFVERLTSSGSCVPLAEPMDYLPVLRELATAGRAAGPLVFDARIAATCLAHGVRELWTADHDFGRFPALRTRNPLVG